jgi:hypothetical protein
MSPQVPFSSEFRATFVAFERTLVGVLFFHVSSKIIGLLEASIAYRTHVRLDVNVMCKHMPSPGYRGLESCSTFSAIIGSCVCVDYSMSLQVPLNSEFRATFVAFERLLVGVCFHVTSKIGDLLEANIAYRTHVRLDDVMCKHMPTPVFRSLEECTTFIAII